MGGLNWVENCFVLLEILLKIKLRRVAMMTVGLGLRFVLDNGKNWTKLWFGIGTRVVVGL